MIAEQTSTAYAPFGLVTHAADLDLETHTVHTAIGELRVQTGRRDRTDETATLMLHGAAGSWTTFTPLLQAVELRGDRALDNLVIPDLPGWGASPFPSDAAHFTIDHVTRAIATALRGLGYERWRIVGHSFGATLALHLAATEPRATTGLTLVSPTTFGVFDAIRHPSAGLAALPAYVGMRQAMRMLDWREGAGRAVVRGLGRVGFMRGLASPLFRHPGYIDGSVYDALAEEVRPRAFTLASDAAGAYPAEDIWPMVTCPVTALRGEHDVFLARDDLERLGGVVPQLSARTVDDTGHFAHVERPFAVLDALVR
ncbi:MULTISPECIES: alpha/beta fold hydrolase [unclassified Leifsonia]|uniref:alpha/beta fold hydrolase n=1 Tax=unclassified Leifsonia TaxID=2663824 RepID=UPI0006F5CD5E|nr:MULTISPECIES: alpha/beta fold hydrolase [unclassified Leifsonia]KQX05103.1 hypothetical protein ASC59_12845 [Leifsonia sp. Root1293]KRA08736.1 hypothetical protein ASD61_12845 [Leifsonia sp. Root60]